MQRCPFYILKRAVLVVGSWFTYFGSGPIKHITMTSQLPIYQQLYFKFSGLVGLQLHESNKPNFYIKT